MSDEVVVLYHGSCPDGFGAAYAFWKKYGDNAKYIAVYHGESPPDEAYTADELFLVDFAYDRDVILSLRESAGNITVIDHHITSRNKLDGLDFCHFDMNRSGSALAWIYLFREEPPKLIRYIEDRDIWLWKMHQSREILCAIDSYDFSFEKWDEISEGLERGDGFRSLLLEGEAILRYKNFLIKRTIKNRFKLDIKGYKFPVVNTPFLQSEIGAAFADEVGCGAAFYFTGDEYRFSLRSVKGGLDVSKIAEMFPGGGGHAVASGFAIKDLSELSIDEGGKWINWIRSKVL